MALFPMGCVFDCLAGFVPATHDKYASAKTLVRPCPSKQFLINKWKSNFEFTDTLQTKNESTAQRL